MNILKKIAVLLLIVSYCLPAQERTFTFKQHHSPTIRVNIAQHATTQSVPSYANSLYHMRSNLYQNRLTYPTVQRTISPLVNAEIKTYKNWQLAGEKQKLIDKRNELQNTWINRSKIQPQIDALNKIIQDPLTDILHAIKTADFDTALKTLGDYKTQLTQADQAAEIQASIQDSQAEVYGQGDLSTHAGFQAAQKLFKVRSDYKLETIKNNIAKKAIEFRQAQLEKFNEQCRQVIAQDKAVSELNACIDSWSDQLTSEHAAVYKNRIDAAHAVATHNTTSIQRYTLSNQATKMLKDFGLDVADFTTLNGNALQQVLHDEFVSILNKLAPIHTKYQHVESIHSLNKMAIECVDIGRQYNQLNNAAMASQLADFSRHVAIVQDIMVGIAEGVGQGAVNVAHMAMHPIETIQHVAQGAATAFKGLLYASMEQAEIEWAIKLDDLDAAEAKIETVNERFERIETVIKNKLAEMSARDISREITSLGTEFYLQGKLVGVVGEFFEFAQQQLPKIAEGASLLQDERAFLSTVEGIPVHIADKTLNAVKAEQMQLVNNTSKVIANNTEKAVSYIAKELNGRTVLEIQHPVLQNIRTGKALKLDAHHAFSDIVDNFAQYAKKFTIEGGDGILRDLYQIEGSLNGKNGIFEWIVDPRKEYGVTHRFFVKNGKITGKANVY